MLTLALALAVPASAADMLSQRSATTIEPADDLPPPRRGTVAPADDLPPPRRATVLPADDLPPPAARPRSVPARAFRPTVEFGVDDLLLEGGWLPDAVEADNYSTLRTKAYVKWVPARNWELRAGARVDGMVQEGGLADHDEVLADYTDTYVRYRRGDTRLTLGAQTVVWGRVDEVPLADRVSRVDLTRFLLDELPDRRRAQPAVRWEQTLGEFKLDAVALPVFRAAQLPDLASVWSPVNRTTGEVLGIDPALTQWVRGARVDEDEHGSGGGGVRLTQSAGAYDWGVTVARTRQSVPYYRVDLPAATLTAVHPFNTFAGVDFETVTGPYVWRTELGYTEDVPVTLATTAMDTVAALDWVGALEFFPGGEDTRVNIQLVAHALRTDRPILELKEYYGANGELETAFAQGRWKAGLRFAAAFNVNDVYLSPKLSFVGWEPHEIYLAAHYFHGEARTFGGFHEDHSLVTLGLRSRF